MLEFVSVCDYSCYKIGEFHIAFNGIVDYYAFFSVCCERQEYIPVFLLCESGKDTIEGLIKAHTKLVKKLESNNIKRVLSQNYTKCPQYRLCTGNSNLIQHVLLGMYPSPCQSRCIYCPAIKYAHTDWRPGTNNVYEKVFNALEYAISIGLVDADAIWTISSGEITIHPYKDRILDIVKNRSASFWTNCFKYDERIADNLLKNPRSRIHLSIDSGTPETWRKVKGFDNFTEVMGNLIKYYNNSTHSEQIALKYILLPGVNDSYKDYSQLIEIMEKLCIMRLTISRDTFLEYKMTAEENGALMKASGLLTAMLTHAGLKYDFHAFSPHEIECIQLHKVELIHSGVM